MPSRTSRQLMDLPNEILDHLVRFLDEGSFFSFACAHPRLRALCQGSASVERIESNNVTESLIDFISPRALDVRVLDLSDCWSSPANIKCLVQKCRNLSVLNVVNSSLRHHHLLEVLAELETLKDLSAAISEPCEDSVSAFYPSIEKLYLEFDPKSSVMKSLVGVLEHCPGVRYLHLNPMGHGDESTSQNFTRLSAERLANYKTLIISMDMLSHSRRVRFNLLHPILVNDQGLHQLFKFNVLVDHRCWFERQSVEAHGEASRDPAQRTLDDLYLVLHVFGDAFEFPDSFRNSPFGLHVRPFHGEAMRMPNMSLLASLIEIDFSELHIEYSPEAWHSLAEASPAVQALALPNCSLFSTAQIDSVPEVSGRILEALSKLKLRKLHVVRSENCGRKRLSGIFLKSLSGFQCLEELTLDGMEVTEDFFDLVEEPCGLRSIRVAFLNQPSLNRLRGFFTLCKRLREFKFESPDLQLQSHLLWRALGEVELERLCLSTNSINPPDLTMLEQSLRRLFRSLEIFHLHARRVSNAENIRGLLEKEAQKANISRTMNPVRLVELEEPSVSHCENLPMAEFPGRNLCCLVNIIGKSKPPGWHAAHEIASQTRRLSGADS